MGKALINAAPLMALMGRGFRFPRFGTAARVYALAVSRLQDGLAHRYCQRPPAAGSHGITIRYGASARSPANPRDLHATARSSRSIDARRRSFPLSGGSVGFFRT